MRTKRMMVVSAAAVGTLIGLAACSGDSEDSATPEPTVEETTEAASEEPTEEPTEEDTDDEPVSSSGEGTTPAWALEPTSAGELIATVEAGEVTVEVYQVDVVAAKSSSILVDADTNEPLIDEGDDIVYVNYVITNSGAPIQLGSSRIVVDAKYDDWGYLGGMASITDSAQLESLGLNPDSLAPGAFNDSGIYEFGTGETYSFGANFIYQADSPITFTARYVPVDDEGDLLHDERVEAEVEATIE